MRVLFLSAWFPAPPDNGSKIRIYHLLRAIAERHDVTLLSFTNPAEAIDPANLSAYCRIAGLLPYREFQPRRLKALLAFLSPRPRSVVDTYEPAMQALIQRELKTNLYDMVIVSQLAMAIYIEADETLPVILDEIETSSLHDAYLRQSDQLTRFRRWLTWRKMQRYTAQLLTHFSIGTVASEPEREILRQVAPDFQRVAIIPNAADGALLDRAAVQPQPNQLIYQGALTYDANFDAMYYFLVEILPRIQMEVPEVSLKITGSIDPERAEQLPMLKGVALTGYLPDIHAAVAEAWACVVPLRVGGGTRLKILEAFALGTPVVSTTKGVEGLEVVNGEHVLIADDPIGFAEQTLKLLRDPALRARLAKNGRDLIKSKYNWQTVGEQFNQLIDSLAQTR